MSNYLDYALDSMETEFRGKSWNGLSLMATLDKLTASEAASTATWEGYSAWSVALHCAKCKRIVAEGLGAVVAGWPFAEELWFPAPPVVSEETWIADKKMLVSMHEAAMGALRAISEKKLDEIMPVWKAPWGKVIAWLSAHDSFHGAQIRSMGLQPFKTKKHD